METMSMPNAHNDIKTLFTAIAHDDDAAFRELFVQYREKVYATAFKWTKAAFAAEEITQDVFISLWTSRAQLAAVQDAQAYLFTIVFNKVSRHLKKESNQARILRLSLWNAKEYSNETQETIDAREGQQFLQRAIAQLSPVKQRIYELKRTQGKSYDEIAETLRLSPHTVKSHLMKAIKFIRNYVRDNALFLLWLMTFLHA